MWLNFTFAFLSPCVQGAHSISSLFSCHFEVSEASKVDNFTNPVTICGVDFSPCRHETLLASVV